MVPASEYWALQAQVSKLQRLLGKKTMMEAEILRETVSRAAGQKNCCCARPRCRGTVSNRGPAAEVVASVASLAAYATNDNAALGGGVSGFIAVVAGAGFEPAAFRL